MQGVVVNVTSIQDGYQLTVVIKKPSINAKEGTAEYDKEFRNAEKFMGEMGLGRVEIKYC